jgi:hypothetical protein
VLLSNKFDFEVRSDAARGRLLVSDRFKMWPVHFLRIATSVAISREQKEGSVHPIRPPLVTHIDLSMRHGVAKAELKRHPPSL